jgi:hypothetical protein
MEYDARVPRKSTPIYHDDDELSMTQLSEYLGVSLRAANGLVARGNFPGARKLNPNQVKSPWLIPFRDVKDYKKKRAQASSA